MTALPGACALINALVISGRPARRFCFEAFLPYDKKERKKILDQLKDETRTIILYEAPHHLEKTLRDLKESLGNRKMTLCRELTKKYESVHLTTIEDLLEKLETNPPRGECVLIIEGRSFEELEEESRESFLKMPLEEHMAIYLNQGYSRKEAMKMTAKDRGVSKRDIYQQLLQQK